MYILYKLKFIRKQKQKSSIPVFLRDNHSLHIVICFQTFFLVYVIFFFIVILNFEAEIPLSL